VAYILNADYNEKQLFQQPSIKDEEGDLFHGNGNDHQLNRNEKAAFPAGLHSVSRDVSTPHCVHPIHDTKHGEDERIMLMRRWVRRR